LRLSGHGLSVSAQTAIRALRFFLTRGGYVGLVDVWGQRRQIDRRRRHKRLAECHEARAASWAARGERERADLERYAADIQRAAGHIVCHSAAES
jgi:hypothetical protein